MSFFPRSLDLVLTGPLLASFGWERDKWLHEFSCGWRGLACRKSRNPPRLLLLLLVLQGPLFSWQHAYQKLNLLPLQRLETLAFAACACVCCVTELQKRLKHDSVLFFLAEPACNHDDDARFETNTFTMKEQASVRLPLSILSRQDLDCRDVLRRLARLSFCRCRRC